MSIKRVLLVCAVVLCAVTSTAVFVRTEMQRWELANRLGRRSNTRWSALTHYLDCDYLAVGISKHQFDRRVQVLADDASIYGELYQREGELRVRGDLRVRFEDLGIADRMYYFSEGKVIGVYVDPGYGLDGGQEVTCE